MSSKKVVFFSDSHTYWHGDRQLKSMGKCLSKYQPPYNEDYWLTHTAFKDLFGDEYMEHYRSFGVMTPPAEELYLPFIRQISPTKFMECKKKWKDVWKRKNNEANFKGTRFHDEMEMECYLKGYSENRWDGQPYPVKKYEKEYPNESLMLDLYKLPDGCYPELLVFDLKNGIAGQADLVYIETKGKNRYIDIDDYKTNEKKPAKSSPERLWDPFEDFYNSKHQIYTFQMGGYAKLLERFGFIVRNVGYTWYKNYDKTKPTYIDVDYLSEELEIILQ